MQLAVKCDAMPLVYLKNLEQGKLGVWEIKENLETLLDLAELNEENKIQLASFKNEFRKLEWLTSRILLKELIAAPEPIFIQYEKEGKPYLINSEFKVSISHSKRFVAVIISKHVPTGLDIECIPQSEGQSWKVETIAHKFAGDKELEQIEPELRQEKLLLHWAAKESLYKCLGNSQLLFREHIYIEPFLLSHEGVLTARVMNKKSHALTYEKTPDYVLVYMFDTLQD